MKKLGCFSTVDIFLDTEKFGGQKGDLVRMPESILNEEVVSQIGYQLIFCLVSGNIFQCKAKKCYKQ
jgi:hypothetical protein